MSAIDNTAELESLAAELTTPVHERAVEEDQDDLSRYEEYRARTSPEAPPVQHAEAEEDADDDVQPDMTGEKRVPLAALHKERQRRQQLQAQLQAQAAQQQQLQQQWAALVAQVQAAQAQAQQPPQQPVQAQQLPDFAEDPEGHVKALQQQLQAVQQQQQASQQMQEVAARENHVRQVIAANAQQIASEVEPVEAAYQQENPDWPEAFDFMQRHADEAIMQRYPGMPRQQVELIKTLAIAKLHEDCRRNGTNPCALVHAEARRLGFQAQARAVAQPAGAPRLDNLSLADVASMDDAAFDALWKDMQWSGYVQPKVG
ncbi:hypothetical protein OF001_U20364 [Pseudomonas sp. OF001]|uniref:hypothetical protein n=1 Tax=Pseudomonas sp. OF001 TaxID=2772300 RepID=UPI0019181AB1|nr:hypothetical protein [Pseudomonas sp. OF001]CAD5377437.1 hypothetical protein OF001_U20364 [Pseudomonas sp. OF001]